MKTDFSVKFLIFFSVSTVNSFHLLEVILHWFSVCVLRSKWISCFRHVSLCL